VHLWLRNSGEPVSETPNGTGTVNAHDVPRLAVALGLGELVAEPANLKPGNSNPVWAAETDRGEWIIKTVQPPGAWWFDAREKSGALELAARQAGVPVAMPADDRGDVGLWHDVGSDLYARAVRLVEGHHPTTPVDTKVASWIGTSLAAIERVSMSADASSDSGYRLYPEAQWAEWIREAITNDCLDGRSAATLSSSVADISAIIAAGRQLRLPYQRLHRDVRPTNIIITRDGPVLLDFDHAGPQVPWWEFVGHSFALASPLLGVVEPSKPTVTAALASYVSGGGQVGHADGTAFTGMFAARLSYAAYLLWVACGHHGSDLATRKKTEKSLREAIACLPAIRSGVDRWARWLG
jgi:aminoglycoside phosphotransferase (APT) family kinase protein